MFSNWKQEQATTAIKTNGIFEQWHSIIWSTYNNIQTWFTLFKKELIDLGFACAATVDDGNDVGELIFFPGQLDWILDIDKSEVSTDGTSNLVGGWPVTRWVGTVSRDSPGAKLLLTNRSGYSATFIGGSIMSGWPVRSLFKWRL